MRDLAAAAVLLGLVIGAAAWITLLVDRADPPARDLTDEQVAAIDDLDAADTQPVRRWPR